MYRFVSAFLQAVVIALVCTSLTIPLSQPPAHAQANFPTPSGGIFLTEDADYYAEFGTGMVFEESETYAALPKRKRTRGVVMFDRINLGRFFPPPGKQGRQGSCAAWAVGYGVRSYYQAAIVGAPLTGPEAISPSYIFNQITPAAFDESLPCTGATLTSALDLLKTVGSVSLSDWTYDPNTCRPAPDKTLENKAADGRIVDYTSFSTPELQDTRRFKEVLANGHPITVAMKINLDEFMSYRGGLYESTSDSSAAKGAHGLVVVGYDDDMGGFLLYNSWGTKWGDNGTMWISYETFHEQVSEAYVVEGLPPPPGVFERSVSGLPSLLPTLGTPPNLIKLRPHTQSPSTTPISLKDTDAAETLSGETSPTPPVAPDVATTTPTLAEQRVSLDALAAEARCARLHVGAMDGQLSFTGFAGPRERDMILQKAAEVAPDMVADVKEMSWPACEAAVLLPADTVASDLVVVAEPLSKMTGEQKDVVRLAENERFRIAAAGSQGPSFLQIFYLQADQSAKEIYRGEALDAEEGVFGVSIGETVAGLKASKPFGPEAVIVMASDGPVISGERGMNVAELDFLNLLREGVESVKAQDRPFASVMQHIQVIGQDRDAITQRTLITAREAASLMELEGADAADNATLEPFSYASDGSEPIDLFRHDNDLAFTVGEIFAKELSLYYRSATGLVDITPRLLAMAKLNNGVLTLTDVKVPEGAYRFRLQRNSDDHGTAAIEFTITG